MHAAMGIIVNELHVVNQTVPVRCLFLYVSATSFIENHNLNSQHGILLYVLEYKDKGQKKPSAYIFCSRIIIQAKGWFMAVIILVMFYTERVGCVYHRYVVFWGSLTVSTHLGRQYCCQRSRDRLYIPVRPPHCTKLSTATAVAFVFSYDV